MSSAPTSNERAPAYELAYQEGVRAAVAAQACRTGFGVLGLPDGGWRPHSRPCDSRADREHQR